MLFLYTILLYFDSFGTKPAFFIKGNSELQTVLGGVLSIIIYAVSLVAACYFAQELINKSNPTVGTANLINDHPENLTYPNPLFFMFTLENDYIPMIDESVYLPVAQLIKTVKEGGESKVITTDIGVKICSEIITEDMPIYELVKEKDLTKYYCLDPNPTTIDSSELSVNEFWGNDGFRMLQIKLYQCGYNDEPLGTCQDVYDVEGHIDDQRVSFFILDNSVDTTNHSNPFLSGLDEKFFDVSTEQ